MFLGNITGKRFRLNNLAVGSVGVDNTLVVNVNVGNTSGIQAGDAGFAIPTAAINAGMSMLIPVLAINTNTLSLFFANATNGALDPADTLDYNVWLFDNRGEEQATIG